jgi:hypothetical protein
MQSGNVSLSGNGELIIAVRDNASIQITGDGTCEEYQRGNLSITRCRGFNGEASVSGNGFAVRVRGRDIVLDARGRGYARLRGEGWYEANGTSGNWSATGQEVSID